MPISGLGYCFFARNKAVLSAGIFFRGGGRKNSCRGFTLLELVCTIVVVAIIAIPLSLLLFEHVQSVFQSGSHSQALNLARFEMEKINNTPYGNVVSASFANYQGYNYDCIRTVTYVFGHDAAPESLKKVAVDIKRAGETGVVMRLVTYLAKNLSYGP